MGQCLRKIRNFFDETEPAPHSFKASIRAKETAKATHKGNLLLTDNEILFYENRKPDPLYQWELQFVRKYGVEKKIFSIHVGTRTKTGEGQFLFRCRQAEQLGKEIEERINTMARQSKFTSVSGQTKYTSSSSRPLLPSDDRMGGSTTVDGPQDAYQNIGPQSQVADDQAAGDLYINVPSPKMASHSSKHADAAEDANQTQSYIQLEPNPRGHGSMSPILAANSDSQRPEQAEINYTEIDIDLTKAAEASQKPIT